MFLWACIDSLRTQHSYITDWQLVVPSNRRQEKKRGFCLRVELVCLIELHHKVCFTNYSEAHKFSRRQ